MTSHLVTFASLNQKANPLREHLLRIVGVRRRKPGRNFIYNQLLQSDEPDKQELLDFTESISNSTSKKAKNWCGEMDMIDLQKTVANYYYDPVTGGSNSIKAIFPAVSNQVFIYRTNTDHL